MHINEIFLHILHQLLFSNKSFNRNVLISITKRENKTKIETNNIFEGNKKRSQNL